MKSYLLVLWTVVFSFSGVASASDLCTSALSHSTLSLPRELKISEGAARYLMSVGPHASSLGSISRIFLALGNLDIELSEVGVDLAESEPSQFADLDLTQNDFFKAHPHKISLETKRNFLILSTSSLAPFLNSGDLGLLAYLWRKTPHNASGQTLLMTLEKTQVAEQMRQKMARTQYLLSIPQYRQAFAALINDQDGRDSYDKLFEAARLASRNKTGFDRPEDLDQTARDLARGRPLKKSAILNLNRLMDSFGLDISQYGNQELGLRAAWLNNSVMTYYRDEFLASIGPFFAEKLHLKSHLNSLSTLLDHLFFGSQLPWSSQQLYQSAIDETKTLLLPLKAEYREFQLKEQKEQYGLLKSANVRPFELKLIDMFAPKENLHIRSRHEKSVEQEVVQDQDKLALLSTEDSLRAFTSFGEARRSPAEIVPGKVYKFWFLRESDPRVQSVRLHKDVCEWMKTHAEQAVFLLNALHLGKARSVGQSGIKMLNFLSSSRYDGPIFELKPSNGLRGLLLQVNGVWELLAVTDKYDIHRAVDSLTPMSSDLD